MIHPAMAALTLTLLPGQAPDYRAHIREALAWVQSAPGSYVQYDYVVTAAVRLGLFWLSRDDAGLSYIRMGGDAAGNEFIQLVLGSDPAKAPLRINRWGAVTEVVRPREQASAFFGLMRPTKDSSLEAARGELAGEGKPGPHQLQALISRADSRGAVSVGRLVSIPQDLNVHQLAVAQALVMGPLASGAAQPRVLGRAPHGCHNIPGFLFAVRELLEAAALAQKAPVARCFVYHSRNYTLTLNHWEPVPEKKVTVQLRGSPSRIAKTYRELRKAQFQILNHSTGSRTSFQILAGASGALRAVPVQIEYRPAWWLKLILNLSPGGTGGRRGPV